MLFFIANITSNNDVFLHKNSINIQRLLVYIETSTQICQVINVNIDFFYKIIPKNIQDLTIYMQNFIHVNTLIQNTDFSYTIIQ